MSATAVEVDPGTQVRAIGEPVAGDINMSGTSSGGADVAITLAAIPGKVIIVQRVDYSYASAPTGGGITVGDGVSIFFSIDITAAGAGSVEINRIITPETAAIVTLLGGGVVGKVNVIARLGNYGEGNITAPATPTNLVATGSRTDVSLTWTASSGATSYNVQRSVSGANSFSVIGTSSVASYTDSAPPAGAYDYKVAAVNAGGTSAYTSLKSAPVGMTGWWKADAGTWQSSGLTTPATATNDPVGGWADQSGNVNSILQPTSLQAPTLQLSQLNGLPCLRYDGVDDWAAASYTLNLPVTTFAILKMRAIGSASNDVVMTGYGNDNRLAIDDTPRTYVWNGGQNPVGTAYANGVYAIFSWVSTTGTSFLNVNNALITSWAGGSINPGGMTLGGNAGGGHHTAVDFVEVLSFAGALSGAMITAVDNYLNLRAGSIY